MDTRRKTFCCSSSIENFREKLRERTGLKEWNIFSIFKPAIFFGMYNSIDYLKFIIHRGNKKIFWCGSDIINLSKRPFWQKILTRYYMRHYCENKHEQEALSSMGFVPPVICPMIFSKPEIDITYEHLAQPNVYLCMHEGREEEYGLGIVEYVAPLVPEVTFHIYGVDRKPLYKNIIFHGKISEEQFVDEIKDFQAGLRLNAFDGFSDFIAKSILRGQYPITYIYYPKIDWANDMDTLVELLIELKNKKEPNYEGRYYWIKELEDNLCMVLS